MIRAGLALLLATCSLAAWALDAAPVERQRQVRAAAASSPAASAPRPPGELHPFIDAHAHLNDAAMQLDLMQTWGATQAVVFWGGRSTNASVAEAARRWPDRFIAFASISPERTAYRPAWEGDPEPLLAELDALLASGLYRGIGEISAVHFPSAGMVEADFDPSGPMVDGILALARKHRVPVLLHVEVTRMAELSRLLDRYPDVPVIWAHGGYTPMFLARRMLVRHANLYYELSARTWPRHPRSPDYTLLRNGHAAWPEWLQLIEAHPERFVVGTDASGRSRGSDAMKFASVQNLLGQLSDAARRRVGSENMRMLVGAPSASCPSATAPRDQGKPC